MRCRCWIAALAAVVALGGGCILDPVSLFDQDGDGFELSVDCDDSDPQVGSLYLDGDGDGVGAGASTSGCGAGVQGVAVGGDCDDGDPQKYPGAGEICNQADDDCDEEIDEDLLWRDFYPDGDGDGFGDGEVSVSGCGRPAGYVVDDTDCDDLNSTVYPDASELCNDVDDDCDESVDEGVLIDVWIDEDEDGYGRVESKSTEVCTVPTGFASNDQDCNDTSSQIHPGAQEACNGVDDDCNGVVDDGEMTVYYQDFDHDGFGNEASQLEGCGIPVGFVVDSSDCDDNSASVYPGAAETCNDWDDDCDGLVDDGAEIVAIAAGGYHTLALCSDGVALTWGDNTYGQLGDGSDESRGWPLPIPGLSDVVAVAAGTYHSFASRRVAGDGGNTLWAWGANYAGQLGDGSTTERWTPVKIQGLSNVIAVSGGEGHSLALLETGSTGAGVVAAWGRNFAGEVGDGSRVMRVAPVTLTSLADVVSVVAGAAHSLALRWPEGEEQGEIWAWGENAQGQVGDGSTEARDRPVFILSDVIGIGAGGRHSLAIRSGGAGAGGDLWAWGDNEYGQLGQTGTLVESSPVPVAGLSDIVLAVGGRYHSLAISQPGDTSAATVWSWGRNSQGALGDGTTASRGTPMILGGLQGGTEVAAGDEHSLAIGNINGVVGGTVWAWGGNAFGQLGDGTDIDRLVPVPIEGL